MNEELKEKLEQDMLDILEELENTVDPEERTRLISEYKSLNAELQKIEETITKAEDIHLKSRNELIGHGAKIANTVIEGGFGVLLVAGIHKIEEEHLFNKDLFSVIRGWFPKK